MKRFVKSIRLDWEEPLGHIEIIGYSGYREVWDDDREYWTQVCHLPGIYQQVRRLEDEAIQLGALFSMENHAGLILREFGMEILYLVHDGTVILFQHKF